MKTELTICSLLHEVDSVLGMTWLVMQDPLIRWSTSTVYLLDSISSFQRIMGEWLDRQVKAGTVKVLSTNEELESLREPSALLLWKFWNPHTFGQWRVLRPKTLGGVLTPRGMQWLQIFLRCIIPTSACWKCRNWATMLQCWRGL